jgi:tetratricopeptide (TPR) repeat protein
VKRRRPGFEAASSFLSAWMLCCLAAQLSCATASPSSHADGGAPSEPDRVEANALLDEADLALARGQSQVAEGAYLQVLEASPENRRALAGLARVAIAAGELEVALDYDDRARAGGDEVPGQLGVRERCTLWLATASERIEAGAASAAGLLDRIASEPACPDRDLPDLRARIFLLEARGAHGRGDFEEALAACRLAVEADPSQAAADVVAASWLLDAGRRREALAWLGDALARHPDDGNLQHLMLVALGVPEA